MTMMGGDRQTPRRLMMLGCLRLAISPASCAGGGWRHQCGGKGMWAGQRQGARA